MSKTFSVNHTLSAPGTSEKKKGLLIGKHRTAGHESTFPSVYKHTDKWYCTVNFIPLKTSFISQAPQFQQCQEFISVLHTQSMSRQKSSYFKMQTTPQIKDIFEYFSSTLGSHLHSLVVTSSQRELNKTATLIDGNA